METVLMVLGIIALVCFIILSLVSLAAMSWYYVTFKSVWGPLEGIGDQE